MSQLDDMAEFETGTYFAEELPERLHDMTQPYPLPWAVYQKGQFMKMWIADCVDKPTALKLIKALASE